MSLPVITVADYVTLLNHALRTVPSEGVIIVGEVLEYRVSQGKWVNFLLKDENEDVQIACFATVFTLATPLANGMKVHVRGYARIFERFGKLSLNVESAEPVGEGALAKAYALLKAKLEAEGLFDAGRKRSILRFPERIGLITSPEAAAYGDFLRILRNRFAGITILFASVQVQGQYAVEQILDAFVRFNALPVAERPEVIVLTRGGGSVEELHAFNDERVARAVFSSVVPVVVGVGHERDESLCDFVADVRASTPSNAAERVVPDRAHVERDIGLSCRRMEETLRYFVESSLRTIDRAALVFDRFLDVRRERLSTMERVLKNVDPRAVLRRGYAIVRAKGRVVKDTATLAEGERIRVEFARGSIDASVERTSLEHQARLL